MGSGFRLVMMWLLLLALPLQGFATATMVNCGPNQHRMWQASSSAQPGVHHHQAGHGGHQHAMGSADLEAMSASGGQGDVGSSDHPLTKLSSFKCSACAACCIGVALPTAAIVFASFSPAVAPDSFVPVSHVAFLTDGPERPPRLSLV